MEGGPSDNLKKVGEFVDDDLLSCFLWAAGENAVAQPGWESPSINPLKGIPLPPMMPELPSAGLPGSAMDDDDGNGTGNEETGDEAAAFGGAIDGLDIGHIGDISKLGSKQQQHGDAGDQHEEAAPVLNKEQKLTQRMQRKAESARIARLRKKGYVMGLEEQVKALRAELESVRAQKGSGGESAPSGEQPRLREEGQRQLSAMRC